MKYVWAEWDKLKSSLLSKKDKLIFLDFDGTLAPIAKTPDSVSLDPEIRRTLKKLSLAPGSHLILISGRPVKQLRKYLRLPHVLYVGNHGLEMNGNSVVLPPKAKKARKLRGLIKILVRKFRMAFNSSYEGVLVEDKNFTLSLHYRNLPKEQTTAFMQLVDFFRKRYQRFPLTWSRGKKVWEISPSVFWGKGDAVLHLLKRYPKALPVAVGDDRADEDMFKVLKNRGMTIRVGYLKSSKAKFYLNSPYDVKVFLKKLCP